MSKEDILKKKLDNDELDNVAGGSMIYDEKEGIFKTDCRCVSGGGGTADRYQKTCACVGYGQGDLTDEGKALGNTQGDEQALYCFLHGGF